MNAPGNNYLQTMKNTSLLSGGNNAFVESLYEDYLQDASSVPAEWRAYFDKLQAVNTGHDVAHSPIQRGFLESGKRKAETPVRGDETRKQASVLQLINAHRFLGARIADLDPLKRNPKPEVAELNPSYYGLSEADMDATFFTGSLVGASGIILNAAAYTHTSVALYDALRACEKPIIEVHLSNPYRREQFRRHSYVSLVAAGIIVGFREAGYTMAVDAMAKIIGSGAHERRRPN